MASVPNGSFPDLDALDQAATAEPASDTLDQTATTPAPADDSTATTPASDALTPSTDASATDQGAAPVSDALDDTEQNTEIQTAAPNITFAAQNVQPPQQAGIYVDVNDSVQVTVWNSNPALTSVTVQLRTLLLDGTLQTTQVQVNNIPATRTATVQAILPGECFILSAICGPPGVPNLRGQTFVNCTLIRGSGASAVTLFTLFADYLTAGMAPEWPNGRVLSSLDGPGYVYIVSGPAPGPGVAPGLAQPANAQWRVLGVRAELVTSATAGNRQVGFAWKLPSLLIAFEVYSNNEQPASTDWFYSSAPGVAFTPSANPAQVMPSPVDFMVIGNDLLVLCNGLQATDNFSAVTALVEEWIAV